MLAVVLAHKPGLSHDLYRETHSLVQGDWLDFQAPSSSLRIPAAHLLQWQESHPPGHDAAGRPVLCDP